jgi:hypothetical protein
MKDLRIVICALVALFVSTSALAQDADPVQQAEQYVKDAMADGKCGDAIKKCGTQLNLVKNIKASRNACKALRVCKKKCRKDKRSTKKASRATKKDCKKACKGKKGKAKRKCKKACRKTHRATKKDARGDKKGCKKACQATHKTPACKSARKAAWKGAFDCAKSLATNKDCQRRAKQLGEKIKSALEASGQ